MRDERIVVISASKCLHAWVQVESAEWRGSWLAALDGGFEFVLDKVRAGYKVVSGMVRKKNKAKVEPGNELRVHLLRLSESCPFHHANPEDCPLFPLRKIAPAKRVQWINALSESDLEYLAAYHRVCLGIRMESLPPQ